MPEQDGSGSNCWTTGDCDGQVCGIDADPEPIMCEERVPSTTPYRFIVMHAPAGDSVAARILRGFAASRTMVRAGPIQGVITYTAPLHPPVSYEGRISIEGTPPSLMLVLQLKVDGRAVRIETWSRGAAGRVVDVSGAVTQEW
jgi:hypothetical protein